MKQRRKGRRRKSQFVGSVLDNRESTVFGAGERLQPGNQADDMVGIAAGIGETSWV
jgi:hypothetical protein